MGWKKKTYGLPSDLWYIVTAECSRQRGLPTLTWWFWSRKDLSTLGGRLVQKEVLQERNRDIKKNTNNVVDKRRNGKWKVCLILSVNWTENKYADTNQTWSFHRGFEFFSQTLSSGTYQNGAISKVSSWRKAQVNVVLKNVEHSRAVMIETRTLHLQTNTLRQFYDSLLIPTET